MVSRIASRALAVVLLLSSAAVAQTGGFAGMSGSWSGSGSVTLASGATERIRCRATYEVTPSGNTFQQSLRCASDSYNFDLRSSVVRSGDTVSGTWSETSRNVTGGIAGRVSGSQIQAMIQGPAFSASLTMATHGDRQTVSIRSQGTEVSAVSIVLRRA